MGEATRERPEGLSAGIFRLVVGAGLVATLAANLPGQMSLDSVITLFEARTDVRQTWAPPVSSWLLKLFDGVVAGTGLYVTASAALLYFSLMSLVRLRGRATWGGVVLAALALATPQFLIYQGIVWRDVLFANLSLAGFIMLGHAARHWRPGLSRILPLSGALACLTLAALVRQNGPILALAAAGVLAWTARSGGRKASLAWGLGSLAAAGVLSLAVNQLAQPPEISKTLRPEAAALILEHYDVVGAKAHHPKLKLDAIGAADPAARDLLESQSAAHYSAARVDTLDADPVFRKTLWRVPAAVMQAQWRDVILHDPAAYALHRLDVFRWTLLTPELEKCLPVQVGVEGPAEMLAELDVQAGADRQDQALAAYAKRFYGTPIYSHLAWALVAVGMIVLLWRRGDAADWAIIGLLGGALAFAASFALISVACDYRYLYLLDVAAMTALIYVALDPPSRRRA